MDNVELVKSVDFVDRDKILETLMEVVGDCSTWISECQLSEADKEAAVVCLAEISGAVRLTGLLLHEDISTIHLGDA